MPVCPLLSTSSLPQIKGTYLVVYGPVKTFLIVSVLVLMGAVSSYLLELHYVLWPLQGLMLGVCVEGGEGGGGGVRGGVRGEGWSKECGVECGMECGVGCGVRVKMCWVMCM